MAVDFFKLLLVLYLDWLCSDGMFVSLIHLRVLIRLPYQPLKPWGLARYYQCYIHSSSMELPTLIVSGPIESICAFRSRYS